MAGLLSSAAERGRLRALEELGMSHSPKNVLKPLVRKMKSAWHILPALLRKTQKLLGERVTGV